MKKLSLLAALLLAVGTCSGCSAAESAATVIQAQGLAQKRAIEGYTYQQERSFDVAEKVAQNEGAGNFSSAGIGLGMMAGVGGAVGGVVGGAVNDAFAATPTKPQGAGFCENCGAPLANGMAFCENCGHPLAQSKPRCSRCGYVFERPGNFCPKCGQKREGV